MPVMEALHYQSLLSPQDWRLTGTCTSVRTQTHPWSRNMSRRGTRNRRSRLRTATAILRRGKFSAKYGHKIKNVWMLICQIYLIWSRTVTIIIRTNILNSTLPYKNITMVKPSRALVPSKEVGDRRHQTRVYGHRL